MTFTSIPLSLRPVVEAVERTLFHGDLDILEGPATPIAESAILAFLNACIERGVGRASTGALAAEGAFVAVELRDGEYVNKGSFSAIILNLGATDDTA
jgi:hypothetical protein